MKHVKCPECNVLITRHKCVVCKKNWVCPECADKRGFDELSNITCKDCGPGQGQKQPQKDFSIEIGRDDLPIRFDHIKKFREMYDHASEVKKIVTLTFSDGKDKEVLGFKGFFKSAPRSDLKQILFDVQTCTDAGENIYFPTLFDMNTITTMKVDDEEDEDYFERVKKNSKL